nr:MAG TPA: hypothetical protein [Caudoviricetes sp.]
MFIANMPIPHILYMFPYRLDYILIKKEAS